MEIRLPRRLMIRQIIESIGNGLYPGEKLPEREKKNRRIPTSVDYEQLRIAIQYQFLTATTAAEVAGKYRPISKPLKNAYKINIDGQEAVIFPIKKGRLGEEDDPIMRAVCLPLNRTYEPWTREVYDYVDAHPDPFCFAKEDNRSSRIVQETIKYMFNTVIWKSEWNIVLPGLDYRPTDKTNFTSQSLYWFRLYLLYNRNNFTLNDLNSFIGIDDDHKKLVPFEKNEEKARDLFRNKAESYFHRLTSVPYSSNDE